MLSHSHLLTNIGYHSGTYLGYWWAHLHIGCLPSMGCFTTLWLVLNTSISREGKEKETYQELWHVWDSTLLTRQLVSLSHFHGPGGRREVSGFETIDNLALPAVHIVSSIIFTCWFHRSWFLQSKRKRVTSPLHMQWVVEYKDTCL